MNDRAEIAGNHPGLRSPRPPVERSLPPVPHGWYAVACSGDLGPGQVREVTLAGRPLALFRVRSGAPVLLPRFCPHLGANLGDGRVEGDTLVCPMHHFVFDATGRCVRTGYGTKPPPRCATTPIRVRELNGLVLAWVPPRDDDSEPGWMPPTLERDGFGAMRTHLIARLPTHPQETTENSVDIGHFGVIHGYRDLEITTPLTTDGAYLAIAYRVTRPPFVRIMRPFRIHMSIHVHGLGYSFVDVDVESHGLRMRYMVLPTPTEPGFIDLRLTTAMRGDRGLVGRVPNRLLDALLGDFMLKSFVAEVHQDVPLWTAKTNLVKPALAEGDGPIGRYRQWARQFYR